MEIGPFDAEALRRYAEVSGDDNPLHLDDALAASIGFSAPPVHGMKLLAAFEPMLRAWRADLELVGLGGTFVQPAPRGEKLVLTGRVLRVDPRERVRAALCAWLGARPGDHRRGDAKAFQRRVFKRNGGRFASRERVDAFRPGGLS